MIESEATIWSEFPSGRKTTVEHILVSVEINRSKGGGLWQSQLGIQVGKLTMWIRLFELEELKQLTRSIISTRICYLLLLKSPKTNTLADGLIEIASSVWDQIASKTVGKKIDGNQ